MRADADGIITARSAEAGQVVAQAQAVYTLARDGPRDAVFNVHEWGLANVDMDKGFAISMVSDPAVATTGDVREISPVVNPNTMTITVKVRLRETPYAMVLGSVVNGVAPMKLRKAFLLPWSSLYERNGKPAVWVIDPRSTTVKLVQVVVDRYDRSGVSVLSGLENGQIVVTEGVQMLHPGQKVEIAAETKP
jgi:RND family efflux transporter MFP subunit